MGNLKCMLSYQEKCEIIKYTHPEELLNKLIFKNSTTDLKLGIFIHIIVYKTRLVSGLHYQSMDFR